MTVSRQQELIESFTDFLSRYYEEAVAELAVAYPEDQQSLAVEWMDLFRYDSDLAEAYLSDPREYQDALEDALNRVTLPGAANTDLSNAHVRVLPHASDVYGVPEVGAAEVGEFVGLEGQIAKVTEKQPSPVQVAFECLRCSTVTTIAQHGDRTSEPHECEGCERQGPFQALVSHDETEMIDHQVVRLTQPPEETRGGSGDHLDVLLEDDLVGSVDPGDRAQINGVFNVDLPDGNGRPEKYLDGLSVDVRETDFSEIDVDEYRDEIHALARGEEGDPYDLLIDSIAPKLQYDPEIKEAVALQLFGGVAVEYPNGNYDRGDPHILLLGDPGTGKSTLLRAVESISPRSAYASGKGASAAGMTAAAVSDDFGDAAWSLEAGALVLANNGVACVDEIDKIDEDARQSLHDALESQRVNINKAGINATLPAKTALLAGGNPKYGRFDPYEPLAEQIGLGPTLLSRFDLVFLLSDEPDREEDEQVSRHGIESRHEGIRYTKAGEEAERISPAVEHDLLRAWVALARQEVTPEWRDEGVKESLVKSFVELRQVNGGDDERSPVPVTYRVQESIARLAEASARVRLSEVVTEEDLNRARRLVGRYLRQVGMDPDAKTFDADLVEADTTTSQRQAIQAILAIVDDEMDGKLDSVPIEDIVSKAAEEGLNAQKVRDRIRYLVEERGELARQDGEVWVV